MLDSRLISWAERGWLPDAVIRTGIRHLLRMRLQQIAGSPNPVADFARAMRHAPMVTAAAEANCQHYEVPSEFFRRVLGTRLKYSCALWQKDCLSLDAAEEAMLALTCQRAEITDGMDILELGCGWGSLSLWMAEQYPNSEILSISNSRTQRDFIEHCACERGLTNLKILTRNVSDFESSWRFDRVVSVEMFEHVRNHAKLLSNISNWLNADGKLFVHIFCHRSSPYTFEANSSTDWMARNFFTGGMMPSADLFAEYHEQLTIKRQWQIGGHHYSRTCKAWLQRLDEQYDELLAMFSGNSDPRTARIRLQRWRVFFMACSELFATRAGTEWYVAHYLFEHAHEPTFAA